jgi:hypothetical protein
MGEETLKGNRMKVQVNTSNDIENKEALERWAGEFLGEQLARFEQDNTSISVQLSSANHAATGGVDKRCMMEARITGRAPVAVTHFAPDQNLAFRGAADKLAKALDHAFGKLDRREHRERETIRREPDAVVEGLPPQA